MTVTSPVALHKLADWLDKNKGLIGEHASDLVVAQVDLSRPQISFFVHLVKHDIEAKTVALIEALDIPLTEAGYLQGTLVGKNFLGELGVRIHLGSEEEYVPSPPKTYINPLKK